MGCDIFNTNGNLEGGSFAVLTPIPLSNGGYIRISTYVVNVGGPYHGIRSFEVHLERLLRSGHPFDVRKADSPIKGAWYFDEIQL